MCNKLVIKFREPEDYDKYLNAVKDIKSDINLKIGVISVDGKSALGIRNLGLNKNITALLVSLNTDEIEKFNELMKDFLV